MSKKLKQLKQQLKKVKIIYIPYIAMISFLQERKKRRNLKKYGNHLLNEICEFFFKKDLKVFCAFGTLLGLIRDKTLIAWDNDIDMGIVNSENFSWEEFEKTLNQFGMKKIRHFIYKGNITEQTYLKDHITIDFFLYEVENGQMSAKVYFRDPTIKYNSNQEYSVRIRTSPMVKNISLKRAGDISFLAPDNSEEYLESVYGRSWRVPDPNYQPDPENKFMIPGVFGYYQLWD